MSELGPGGQCAHVSQVEEEEGAGRLEASLGAIYLVRDRLCGGHRYFDPIRTKEVNPEDASL